MYLNNLCSLNIGGYLGGISPLNILGRARYPPICHYTCRGTFGGGVTPILKTNGNFLTINKDMIVVISRNKDSVLISNLIVLN